MRVINVIYLNSKCFVTCLTARQGCVIGVKILNVSRVECHKLSKSSQHLGKCISKCKMKGIIQIEEL